MPRITSLAAQAAAAQTPVTSAPGATPPTAQTAAAQAPAPSAPEAAPPATSPSLPTVHDRLRMFSIARPIKVEPIANKVNYALVFHPMNKKAAAICNAIPAVKEGQVVVLLDDDRIFPVIKLHLIHAVQYWTEMAYEDGEVLRATRQKPINDQRFDEYIESLVVCYTPAGLLAAKASWRKTRTPFAKAMAALCRQEEEEACFQFTGTPVIETRTNRKTGKTYTLLNALINPINAEECQLLQAWLDNSEAQATYLKVKAAYEERLKYLDSRCQ